MMRLYWIDMVKGVCMLCVLFAHCIAYYGIDASWEVTWFHPFYVSAFFFVSGYLFVPKYLGDVTDRWLHIKGGLTKVFFHIVIPTIIFSALVYLPKLLFNGGGFNIFDFLSATIGGTSFWFTSAIAVAQVLILLSIYFLHIRNEIVLLLASVLFAAAGFVISHYDSGVFPWFYKSGMLAMLFMAAGGLYRQYETIIERFIRPKFFTIAVLLFYAICIVLFSGEGQIQCGNIQLNYNLMGWIATLLGVFTIVYCSKCVPEIKFISFIGRNSLVFYFLCGLLPASISTLALKLFPDRNWIILFGIYIAVIVLSTAFVLIINKYLRLLLDIRTLKE